MAAVNQLAAGIAWEKPADLSSRDVLKRLSPSAVKAFLKIRELWELRDEDARTTCWEASQTVHSTN